MDSPAMTISSRPVALEVDAERRAPAKASEWRGVVSVLAAVDELAASAEMEGMLKKAVELARKRIGLERVALYLAEQTGTGFIMRGSFGTNLRGETTDERKCWHECSPAHFEILRRTQVSGGLWLCYDDSPHLVFENGQSVVVGRGWVVITPLVAAGEVIGVMYNDTAVSHAPVDEGKQARTAVFGRLLADLVLSRRRTVSWKAPPREEERKPIVQRILSALSRDPVASGEYLAREMGISPGHLARSFKTEMGVSLVEYRNRLRVERFFATVDRGGSNLQEAAQEAGFGSYAQFHRVFRKLLGTTPREYLTGRRASAPESDWAASIRKSAE
ncbi:MAG TPA: AraC family transcriptional regulator [Polyangiaceae bacterium]